MVTNLVYFSTIAYNAYQSRKQYHTTKAPSSLKELRNALNFISLGYYTCLGIFVLNNFSEDILLDFFLGDGSSATSVLAALPTLFVLSYIIKELITTIYKLWKIIQQDSNLLLKAKDGLFEILQFAVMLALTLSATTVISNTLFPNLMLGYVTLSLWSQVADIFYEIWEKNQLNKQINWQSVMANLYLSLTTVLLLTLMTFQVITIGGVLFNSIACFKAAAYLFAKSFLDYSQNASVGKALGLQLSVAILQTTIGVLLLTGLLVIPETAIAGMILLAIIKNLSLIPAAAAIGEAQEEQVKTLERYKQLGQEAAYPEDMGAADYIQARYQHLNEAKRQSYTDKPYIPSFFQAVPANADAMDEDINLPQAFQA